MIAEKVLDITEIDAADSEFKALLETRFDESHKITKAKITPFLEEEWKGLNRSTKVDFYNTDTSFDKSKLLKLSKFLYSVNDKNLLFKKTQKLLDNREKMVNEDQLDWSMGELLAYATLIDEGYQLELAVKILKEEHFLIDMLLLRKKNLKKKYHYLIIFANQQVLTFIILFYLSMES